MAFGFRRLGRLARFYLSRPTLPLVEPWDPVKSLHQLLITKNFIRPSKQLRPLDSPAICNSSLCLNCVYFEAGCVTHSNDDWGHAEAECEMSWEVDPDLLPSTMPEDSALVQSSWLACTAKNPAELQEALFQRGLAMQNILRRATSYDTTPIIKAVKRQIEFYRHCTPQDLRSHLDEEHEPFCGDDLPELGDAIPDMACQGGYTCPIAIVVLDGDEDEMDDDVCPVCRAHRTYLEMEENPSSQTANRRADYLESVVIPFLQNFAKYGTEEEEDK